MRDRAHLLIRDLWICGITPPPAIVAYTNIFRIDRSQKLTMRRQHASERMSDICQPNGGYPDFASSNRMGSWEQYTP